MEQSTLARLPGLRLLQCLQCNAGCSQTDVPAVISWHDYSHALRRMHVQCRHQAIYQPPESARLPMRSIMRVAV